MTNPGTSHSHKRNRPATWRIVTVPRDGLAGGARLAGRRRNSCGDAAATALQKIANNAYLCVRWDDRSGRTGLSSHTCGMTAVIPQVSWGDSGPTWAALGSTWAAGPVPEARKWPRHARGSILRTWRPFWTHFGPFSPI